MGRQRGLRPPDFLFSSYPLSSVAPPPVVIHERVGIAFCVLGPGLQNFVCYFFPTLPLCLLCTARWGDRMVAGANRQAKPRIGKVDLRSAFPLCFLLFIAGRIWVEQMLMPVLSHVLPHVMVRSGSEVV